MSQNPKQYQYEMNSLPPLARPTPSAPRGKRPDGMGGRSPLVGPQWDFSALMVRLIEIGNIIAKAITFLTLAVILAGGVLGLNVIDLAMGAISMGLIFQYNVNIGWAVVGSAVMGLAYTFSTSVIQTAAWIWIAMRGRAGKKVNPAFKVGLVGVLLLDTYFDVASLYPAVLGLPILEFNPFGHGFNFSLVVLIFAILVASGEAFGAFVIHLTEGLIDQFKKNGGWFDV